MENKKIIVPLPLSLSPCLSLSLLQPSACSWGKRLVSVNKLIKESGLHPLNLESVTFVLNWHYINKDWLIARVGKIKSGSSWLIDTHQPMRTIGKLWVWVFACIRMCRCLSHGPGEDLILPSGFNCKLFQSLSPTPTSRKVSALSSD